VAVAALCAATVLLGGCLRAGPLQLNQDRLHYANALGDARETQALLNIVKIRYAEFPSFLDLTQVVTNYELTHTLTAGTVVPLNIEEGKDKFASVSTIYSTVMLERPSFVYLPVEGPELVRKMLSPGDVRVILGLTRTGWAIDSLMSTMALSANSRMNRDIQTLTVSQPDPEFLAFIRAARQAQTENALTIRFEPPTPEEAAARLDDIAAATAAPTSFARRVALANLGPTPVTTRMCFKTSRLSETARAMLGEMREGLQLDPGRECYLVIAADRAPDEKTIALQMRSLFQLMTELALFVEVPTADLASGAAPPLAWSGFGGEPETRGLLRIRSGAVPPGNAAVVIEYRGSWFWIDAGDQESKTTFLYLILLLSITESGGSGAQLVVSTN